MANASDGTAPNKPARALASNTTDTSSEKAPPAVSSSPSADTRGPSGTSTAEGPSRAKTNVPSAKSGADHVKTGAKSGHEVSAPGERVDDEHDGAGDKTMTRQE